MSKIFFSFTEDDSEDSSDDLNLGGLTKKDLELDEKKLEEQVNSTYGIFPTQNNVSEETIRKIIFYSIRPAAPLKKLEKNLTNDSSILEKEIKEKKQEEKTEKKEEGLGIKSISSFIKKLISKLTSNNINDGSINEKKKEEKNNLMMKIIFWKKHQKKSKN